MGSFNSKSIILEVQDYFAAVQVGMDKHYKPMEAIFAEIIEWSLAAS